jgi:hypothetical protein
VNNRTLEKAVVLAFGAIYVFLSFISFDQIEEDAFIYFRLAENIADGYGYVFNRGGDRVEAGSSIIWLLILVFLSKLPFHVVISAKIVGILLGVASLGSLYRLGRRLGLGPPWAALPVALTATNIPFVMWGQRGLETPAYTLAVIWLVLAWVDRKLFRYWAAPAVLMLLSRSEGLFVLIPLIPFLWLNRQRKREIQASLAILASAMLLLTAFRFAYFHDLLPSPFYWKFGFGRLYAFGGLHSFLWQSQGYYLIAIILLAIWRRSYWNAGRVVLFGFVLVLAAWSVIARDHMPYYRHLVPAVPLFYVVVATAISDLIRAEQVRVKALVSACFAAFAIWMPLSSDTISYFGQPVSSPIRPAVLSFCSDPGRFVGAVGEKMIQPTTRNHLDDLAERASRIGVNYQVLVGEFLRRRYPDESVIVYDQMGQTAFYAGHDKMFIDSTGLANKKIGHFYFYSRVQERPVLRLYYATLKWICTQFFPEERFIETSEEALDYLFGRGPDVVIVNVTFIRNLAPPFVPRLLLRDERLGREFERKFRLAHVVLVHERKGIQTKSFTPPRGLSVKAF